MLYLACSGAASLAFVHNRRPADVVDALLCAAPLTFYGLVLLRREPELRQAIAKMAAAFLMLPVLLAMWAGSQEPLTAPPAPPTPVVYALEPAALFRGAVTAQVQQAPSPDVALLQSGGFPDGTELRLTRFHSPEGTFHYLTLLQESLGASPFVLGTRRGLRLSGPTVAAGFLVYFEPHGPDLLEVRGADEASVLARLTAQAIPPPTLPKPRARIEASVRIEPVWPYAVAFSIIHVGCFVGFTFWAGALTTRVAKASDLPTVSQGDLEARLLSLQQAGVPCSAHHTAGGDLCVDYTFAEGIARAQRLTLRIDSEQRVVRVREQLGVAGDGPRTSSEADMRSVGSVGIDPTRPKAQRIYARSIATTIIEPERLARVPIQLSGPRVTLSADEAAAADPEQLVYLLCAIVTRSGFTWQPVFFWKQASA